MFPLVIKNVWYKAYFDSSTIFATSFIMVFLWRTIRAKIVSSILKYMIFFLTLFYKVAQIYLINLSNFI